MATPVKRSYSSELRAAQARETRRAIVAAAARLYVEEGFGRTTVDAIADAAGVSRKTVFAAVGGKVELLKLALDWAIVGDDEPIPLRDRPATRELSAQTNPGVIVAGWARRSAAISSRVAGLSAALTVAAGIDKDASALWEQAQAQRLHGARAFVAHLAANGGLGDGLSQQDAADIVWVHSDPSLYHRLVLQRGWSEHRFEGWLAHTITSQLAGED